VFAASNSSLNGEIQGDFDSYSGLQVELAASTSNNFVERVQVAPNGQFEFRSVPLGTYEIRVLGPQNELVKRELIHVSDTFNFVTVRLSERKQVATKGDGTVSLAQLKHRPPKKAMQELLKSEKLRKKGDHQGAIGALLRAVEYDPEYMEALNNLGCRYMETQEPAQAAKYFQQALKLDPSQVSIYVNVAVALLNTGKYRDAIPPARRAFDLDSSNRKARYVLGMSLANSGIYTAETLQLLHASTEFPLARYTLARVYTGFGWYQLAREALGDYIKVAPPEKRVAVEKWMNALRAAK
jgi:predicted Zn-dependent protease